MISGELTLRPWENNEGIKQFSPDVNVVICDLVGGNKKESREKDLPDMGGVPF
jgi:hypothetical protein